MLRDTINISSRLRARTAHRSRPVRQRVKDTTPSKPTPQTTPESVPATVDVPAPTVNEPEYKDTPIPPKNNNQSIDNSVQNDIIELKDRNDSLFPDIADKAPKLSYFDDEALNNQIQSAADSILDMAKNHVRGTEFAYIISTDSPYALSEPIIGGKGMMAVKIPRCDYSAITLHNHPSGGTFSARDIDRFVVDENAKAMCLIGNSGNWYILEKTDSFN